MLKHLLSQRIARILLTERLNASSTSSSFVELVCSRHQEALLALNKKIDAAYLETTNLNKEHAAEPLKLIDQLSQKCLNPEKSVLIPIGSLVFGLRSPNSDFDTVLFVKEKEEREKFAQAISGHIDLRGALLETLAELIRRHAPLVFGKQVTEVISLSFIKPPLLIIKFAEGFSIDVILSYEDFQSIRNTNLLRYYYKADIRLGKMLLFIKRLFEEYDIKKSKAGLLSNYHILMTIVHFLQSEQSLTPWQVLPVLCQTHPSLVGRDVPIEQIIAQLMIPIDDLELDYTSHNKMPVSELIVRYFDYYSSYNLRKDGIFIEKGQARRLLRKYLVEEPRLMIFDPYGLGTVSRSPHILDAFREAVRFTCAKMQNGLLIDSFPEFPEARFFREDTKFSSWRNQA